MNYFKSAKAILCLEHCIGLQSLQEKYLCSRALPMDEMQNASRQVESDVGCVHAYRLGRVFGLMDGWHNSVRLFSRTELPPGKWEFPFELFGYSIELALDRHIAEVRSSLRMLAWRRDRVVDPGVLTEMHRACDEVKECGDQIVKCLVSGDCISDAESKLGPRLLILGLLSRKLIMRRDTLNDWMHLAMFLWSALITLVFECEGSGPPMEEMREFCACGRKLQLPDSILEEAIRLLDPNAKYTGIPKKQDPAGMLISAMLQSETQILKYLQKLEHVRPYLVFDDKNRIVTYFGATISFDDFPAEATGGLNLLRVMAQYPAQPISASRLIENSELVADANQVPVYLSRLRAALQKILTSSKRARIDYLPDSKEAKLFFIVADRRARAKDVSKDTFYKLALPSDRVRYIAPK